MTTAAAPTTDTPARWGHSTTHVRKALKFIKSKGAVTADQLVEWDDSHGRRLFVWNNTEAAERWRLHQARVFMNSFRAQFEGMRVRAIIHIGEDEEQGIDRGGYYAIETISAHQGMRDQVVGDISRRMAVLASELKMWRLTEPERADLFERLRAAME